MASLIDNAAEVGSDEESDFDSDIAEQRPKKSNGASRRHETDSSEEESEDEEAERAVREGFIVDEDEEDDLDDEARRRERRKRRRERLEEEEVLDADDLEVIGIRAPEHDEDGAQVGHVCLFREDGSKLNLAKIQAP
jgi:transcription elongation factor SPT6